MKEDYVVEKFFRNVKAGLETFGVDGFSTLHNVQRLEDAGFTNVEEKVFKVPIGPWAKNSILKTVGRYFRSSLYDGLQGLAMATLTRGLGWDSADVERFLVDVRKGLLDPTQHAYITFHVVFGQKPLSA